MRRRPPRSTLFPYAPLFRSQGSHSLFSAPLLSASPRLRVKTGFREKSHDPSQQILPPPPPLPPAHRPRGCGGSKHVKKSSRATVHPDRGRVLIPFSPPLCPP